MKAKKILMIENCLECFYLAPVFLRGYTCSKHEGKRVAPWCWKNIFPPFCELPYAYHGVIDELAIQFNISKKV